MSPKFRSLISALTIAAAAAFILMPRSSIAHTAAEIDSDVQGTKITEIKPEQY